MAAVALMLLLLQGAVWDEINADSRSALLLDCRLMSVELFSRKFYLPIMLRHVNFSELIDLNVISFCEAYLLKWSSVHYHILF